MSLYTPNWRLDKRRSFVVVELISLFILTFLSLLGVAFGFYTTFYAILAFSSLKMLSLIVMIGLAGTFVAIACLAPIQEITGITYPTIKNIGVGQVGVKPVNGLIFLWIKNSLTGKWYSVLLNTFKYTLWSLPISFIIAVCY
ncbi:MAG: hypothetical protein IPK84_00290 [Candidatus Moraniibacteriota bacterium]|nr:MAG: hypothetical protein IPK84_00290 [Candidatus Moranbacteria bacterium]